MRRLIPPAVADGLTLLDGRQAATNARVLLVDVSGRPVLTEDGTIEEIRAAVQALAMIGDYRSATAILIRNHLQHLCCHCAGAPHKEGDPFCEKCGP